MVFLILTREGFDELKKLFGRPPSPVWINHDVLSLGEIEAIRRDGIAATNYVRYIDPFTVSAIEGAVRTLQEHHPGERVWVEFAPSSNLALDVDAQSRRAT
jgi:hypothetical protein